MRFLILGRWLGLKKKLKTKYHKKSRNRRSWYARMTLNVNIYNLDEQNAQYVKDLNPVVISIVDCRVWSSGWKWSWQDQPCLLFPMLPRDFGTCSIWFTLSCAAFECVYLSANRFSMAWEKGIQVPYPFFVFAWHWKTDLNFTFCLSFSPNFEKRFLTSHFVIRLRITLKNGYQFNSVFVFASLWKMDVDFVLRFSFSHYFEKRIWISFLVFSSYR